MAVLSTGKTKITIRIQGAGKVKRQLRQIERRLRRIIKLQSRIRPMTVSS